MPVEFPAMLVPLDSPNAHLVTIPYSKVEVYYEISLGLDQLFYI